MGIFHNIEETIVFLLGRKVKAEDEDPREYYNEMIESSQNSLHVVAGELQPCFYGGDFAHMLQQKMVSPTYKASILFHKTQSQEEMYERFIHEHPDLASLFREEPERINLYWASQRPRFHFALADTHVMLEQTDHIPLERRDVYFHEHAGLARRYQGHFERMIADERVVQLQPEELDIAA